MKKKQYMFFILTLAVGVGLCPADDAFGFCTVSSTSVNFGSYDVFSAVPLDTSGTISISCDEKPTAKPLIVIGPSPGSGSFDPRIMKHVSAADTLRYNLYVDNARTQIWGDGSGNTQTVQKPVPNKRTEVTTVYGRVQPLQDVSSGSYSDVITVTIIW